MYIRFLPPSIGWYSPSAAQRYEKKRNQEREGGGVRGDVGLVVRVDVATGECIVFVGVLFCCSLLKVEKNAQ